MREDYTTGAAPASGRSSHRPPRNAVAPARVNLGALAVIAASLAVFAVVPDSIADIASYPWVVSSRERLISDPAVYPHVVRWLDAIAARPAVVRAYAMPTAPQPAVLDDEARKHLFGDPAKR